MSLSSEMSEEFGPAIKAHKQQLFKRALLDL